MILQDCTDCAGPACASYQQQTDRPTLGVRMIVEAGITAQIESVQEQLYRCLAPSPQILDDDVFQIHTLPGENGSTDYVALLANRTLRTV